MRPANVLVTVHSPEQFTKALRIFERQVRAEGVMAEARRRQRFVPAHELARRKRAAHRRRARRHGATVQMP